MYADPIEIRRQKQRLYYAQNREVILRRQRLSRQQKKATTATVNGHDTLTQTPATGQSDVTQVEELPCAGCVLP